MHLFSLLVSQLNLMQGCTVSQSRSGPSFYVSFIDHVLVFHTLFLSITCMLSAHFNTFPYTLHPFLSNSLSTAMTTTHSPLFTQQQPIPLVSMNHYHSLSRAKMTPTLWNPDSSLKLLAMFTEMLLHQQHICTVSSRAQRYSEEITRMGCRILGVMLNRIESFPTLILN